MPKLIIDLSFLGGLAPRYFGDKVFDVQNQNLRILGADNQYAGGVANPIARLGYLTPANITTKALTSTIPIQLQRAVQMDYNLPTNTSIYFLEADASAALTKLDDFADTSLVHLRTPGGAIGIGTDLEIYQINGVRKLFASYKGATIGDVMIWDFSSTFDDNWISATVDGTIGLGLNLHKMVVADNGFMYILDGNAVHKIDGTTAGGVNGTATPNVLLFPVDNVLIDGIDLRGKLWMAFRKSPSTILSDVSIRLPVGVYVWDRFQTEVTMSDVISIDGVREIRAMAQFRGVPACFTVSSDGYTQLRIFNGNEFEVIEEMGQNAFPRFPDSIQNTGNLLIWLGVDGKIYAYGKPHPKLKDALFQLGDITTAIFGETFDSVGAIIGASEEEASGVTGDNEWPEAYYLSLKTGTANHVRKWYPHAVQVASGSKNQFPHPNTVYSLVKALPKLSTITSITLYYPPIGLDNATRNMELDIFLNQSATRFGDAHILTNNDGVKGFKYFQIGQKNVNFIQLGLRWISNLTNNGFLRDAITPMFAEVEYELVDKKK